MRVGPALTFTVMVAACGKSSKPAEGSGAAFAGSATTPSAASDAAAAAVDTANAKDAAAAPTGPPDPTSKAKELLDAQVAALKNCEQAATLLATFRSDAVLFTPPGPHEVKDPNAGICEAIASTSPNQNVKSIKQGQLVAGGNASAIWVSTTLEIAATGSKPRTIHVTELLAAPDWKVVAGSFTDSRTLNGFTSNAEPVPGANTPGPLAALVAVPADLDAALASDPGVAVFGTDKAEIAFGAASAHKLLAGWKSLKLSVKSAHEVRDAQWGYVQAAVAWDKPGEEYGPLAMSAMLIAVPAADGKWSIVAASYGAL